MTTSHTATAWPSQYVVVRSADAPTPESTATGEASAFYTLARPLEAPHGTRLLVSVQQLSYPRSFQNVRAEGSAYTITGPSEQTRNGSVPLGVWGNEALVAALNELEEEATRRDPLKVSFAYDAVTGRVTASRTGVPFALGGGLMRTLGFANSQLGEFALSHTGYYASSLRTPHRAMLLQTSSMTTHVECSNGNRGAGTLARIPVEPSLEAFECAHWAPLHPISHLLHDRHISALALRLVDADTHEAVVFTDELGWAVALSFHVVADPPRQIAPERAVPRVAGGVHSQTTHDAKNLHAHITPENGISNTTTGETRGQDRAHRESRAAEGLEDRKPTRAHRRRRRRRKRAS